jgi:hypothetical protein
MKSYRAPWLFTSLLCATSIASAAPMKKERNPSREWLDIPWDMRYVLFVNTKNHMAEYIDYATTFNASDGKDGNDYVYLDLKEMFSHTLTIVVTKTVPIANALIVFDKTGRVLNKAPQLSQFTAKLSNIDKFVLIQIEKPEAKPYSFGRWDQGIPGDSSFSPAFCTTLDSHRYASHWKRNDYRGNVGCREWTAQLYRPEQPYIDITTYSKRGNFIGELVGWARFEDRPRPVIGMQGKQWLCLHECPAGEKPGVIPNIRAWTRQHNFPMPERPARQPVYPNANFKDDLNEFWQGE